MQQGYDFPRPSQGKSAGLWLTVQTWNSFFVQNWTGFPDENVWRDCAQAAGIWEREAAALGLVLDVTVASWEKTGRRAYRNLLLGEGMEAGESDRQKLPFL